MRLFKVIGEGTEVLAEGVVFKDETSVTRLYKCSSPLLAQTTHDPESIKDYVKFNSKVTWQGEPKVDIIEVYREERT